MSPKSVILYMGQCILYLLHPTCGCLHSIMNMFLNKLIWTCGSIFHDKWAKDTDGYFFVCFPLSHSKESNMHDLTQLPVELLSFPCSQLSFFFMSLQQICSVFFPWKTSRILQHEEVGFLFSLSPNPLVKVVNLIILP